MKHTVNGTRKFYLAVCLSFLENVTVKIYLPIFYHSRKAAAIARRLCWPCFGFCQGFQCAIFAVDQSLHSDSTEKWTSMSYHPADTSSTISISVPMSQRQLPPSPANTSLDHRSHFPLSYPATNTVRLKQQPLLLTCFSQKFAVFKEKD